MVNIGNGISFGQVIMWLFVFVAGSLIVTFLVSPNSFNNFKSNIKSLPSSSPAGIVSNTESTEDVLITSCKDSFNECNNIVNQKFNRGYTLIKMEKFESLDGVFDFYKTWQTFAIPVSDAFISAIYLSPCGADCSERLPLVLIAFKGTSQEGITVSQVAFCDKSGKLTSPSKTQAMC